MIKIRICRKCKEPYTTRCNPCHAKYRREYYQKNKERTRAVNQAWYERNADYRKEYYKKNKDTYRNAELMRKFGLTPEQYQEMFDKQVGLCKICNNPETAINKRLSVDHCHKTGKIRALLCTNCNKGIGCLKEDLVSLTNAIAYLQEHK